LRHEDLDMAGRQVAIVPRVSDNGARAKGGRSRFIPTSGELMRLYADYLGVEYGALDSDYVFVNPCDRPHGHPLTYAGDYDLGGRLRRRTGVGFGPHWFRHFLSAFLSCRGWRGAARWEGRRQPARNAVRLGPQRSPGSRAAAGRRVRLRSNP